MDRPYAELRDYYENEARLRLRQTLRGRRIELRDEFVALLRAEQRTSIIDFGAGPGLDVEAFRAAGLHPVGVDLANGNARLAAERGVTVIQGSVTAAPIRSARFDAGWSVSTLMHLDDGDARLAAAELGRVLRPGAPAVIGLWGRDDEGLVIDTDGLPGSGRPFHLRSFERNRRLMADVGDVEAAQRWEGDPSNWDYHVFRLRMG